LVGFLGLLAPSIINKIQDQNKSNKIKQSIRAEVDDFRIIMAATVYSFETRFGNLTHDLIGRIKRYGYQ